MALWRRGPVGWGLGPFAATRMPTGKQVWHSTLFSDGATTEFAVNAASEASAVANLSLAHSFAANAQGLATVTAALRTEAKFAAATTAVATAVATFIENLPTAVAKATANGHLIERANGGGSAFLRQFQIDANPVSGTISGFGYGNYAVIFTWAAHTTGVVGDGVADLTGAWTKVASVSVLEFSTKWIATAWIAPLPPDAATATYSFQFSSGKAFPEAVMGVQYVRGGNFVSASTISHVAGGPSLLVPPAMPVSTTRGMLASSWFTATSLTSMSAAQGWPDPSAEFQATESRLAVGFSSSSGTMYVVSTPLADDLLPAQRGVILTNSASRGAISVLFSAPTTAANTQFVAVASSTASASARLGNAPAPAAITYIETTSEVWRPLLNPFPDPPEMPNRANRATYTFEIPPREPNDLLILTMMSDAQTIEPTDPGWTLAAPPRYLQGQGGGPARYRLYVYWRYDNQSLGDSAGANKWRMVMRGIGQFNTPYDCQALIQCHRWRNAAVVRPEYLFGEAVEAANSGFIDAAAGFGIGQDETGTYLARAPNTAVADANSVVMAVWARSMTVSWSGTTTAPAGMTTILGLRREWRNSTEMLDYLLLSAYKTAGPGQTGDLDNTHSPVMFGRAGVSLVIRPQGVGALFHATARAEPTLAPLALVGSTALAAAATATATATAALTTSVGNTIAAGAAGLATGEATLRTGVLFFASAAGQATGTASLALGQGFAVQAQALAAATADLYTLKPVAATALAQATATPALTTIWPTGATALAQAQAQAALRAAPRFYAAAQAIASASATPPAEKPPKASWALLAQQQTPVRTAPSERTYRRPL